MLALGTGTFIDQYGTLPKLWYGRSSIFLCTTLGIMTLSRHYLIFQGSICDSSIVTQHRITEYLKMLSNRLFSVQLLICKREYQPKTKTIAETLEYDAHLFYSNLAQNYY